MRSPGPGRRLLGLAGLALFGLAAAADAAPDAPAAVPAPAPAPAPAGPALDDPTASPLLNRHYQAGDPGQPTPPPGREVFTRRFEIVHAAAVTPGMRVAAIGDGDGLIAALFARAVGPEGVVYGVVPAGDGATERIAGLNRVVREYRVPNLIPTLATAADTGLPAAGIDLAFIATDGQRSADPRPQLDAIHTALVPYGTLILVAARPPAGPRRTGAPTPVAREALIAAVRAAGFRLVEEPGFLRENDFLRFERIGEEPAAGAGSGPAAATPTGQVQPHMER